MGASKLSISVAVAFAASVAMAAPAGRCQLRERTDELAWSLRSSGKGDGLTENVVQSSTAFNRLKFQAACVPVVASWLASSDETERAAAAAYSYAFQAARTTQWDIPIVSLFTGKVEAVTEARYYPLTRAQIEAIVERAPRETHPMVLLEQLRNVEHVGGHAAALRLVRAAEPLVRSSGQVSAAARSVFESHPRLRELRPSELRLAYGEYIRPPTFTPGPADQGPGQPREEVLALARTFLEEKGTHSCAGFGTVIVAARGDKATLFELARLLPRFQRTFGCRASLIEAVGALPAAEAALVELLPLLRPAPSLLCDSAGDLTDRLPRTASPASYLAVARALAAGAVGSDGKPERCLGSRARVLVSHLAAQVADRESPGRAAQAVQALLELAHLLVKEVDGLWSDGGAIVTAMAELPGDATVAAILAVHRLARGRLDPRLADQAEAAIYLAGGTESAVAEKAAAEVRRHRRR